VAQRRPHGWPAHRTRLSIWDRIPEERREKELSEMTSRQLIARVGEPNEVAEAYLYLMRGGYTTGQVLYVEGGRALTG
jgi:NAD(P)-dependent dehydrogenase (short-subunit alcohol dehydrogenase family)